jgi:hypothetical protein
MKRRRKGSSGRRGGTIGQGSAHEDTQYDSRKVSSVRIKEACIQRPAHTHTLKSEHLPLANGLTCVWATQTELETSSWLLAKYVIPSG